MTHPNTPQLPAGFNIRPATLDDIETIVEFSNICSRAELGADEFEVSEMKISYTEPGFNIADDVRLVFDPQGVMVGLAEVWTTGNPPVMPWLWTRVHPGYLNRGIGTYLMSWSVARAKAAAFPRVPDHYRISAQAAVPYQYQPGQTFLQNFGMTRIRYFWDMTIELETANLPAPQWPADIRLTTYADYGNLPAVVKAVDDAFTDHWGHVETPLEKQIEQWKHWVTQDEELDPNMWYLALIGDEIVGMSLCRQKAYTDPDSGWIDTLGVLRPWRRRGIALALLLHTFHAYREQGRPRCGLGVDAASLTGATRLYEKAGMTVLRRYDRYELELRPGEEYSLRSLDG